MSARGLRGQWELSGGAGQGRAERAGQGRECEAGQGREAGLGREGGLEGATLTAGAWSIQIQLGQGREGGGPTHKQVTQQSWIASTDLAEGDGALTHEGVLDHAVVVVDLRERGERGGGGRVRQGGGGKGG